MTGLKHFVANTMLNPEVLFKDADKFFVGFEDQINRLAKLHDDVTKNIPNYPPYNVKKTGENSYAVDIAVAGFAKHEIDIELADNKLIIRGNTKDDNSSDYLFKGIATRSFTRSFGISDQIEIKDAQLINGMLRVALDRVIPDHKKPRKIEIKEPVQSKKEFLTEEEKDEITSKL